MRCVNSTCGVSTRRRAEKSLGTLGLALIFALALSCEAFGAVITEAARRQAGSATGATQAKHAAALAAEEKLTGGGGSSGGGGSAPASRGADLRAIASPKKGNTSFTGFPSGTLPGEGGEGSGEGEEEKKPELVAMVGDPLMEPISEANMGNGLDRIGAIADHVGYRLVMRNGYRPRSLLEPPYSYYLMRGRKRLKTLFFDHQLKLVRLQ